MGINAVIRKLRKEFPVPKGGMDDPDAMMELKDEMDAERYVREDGMTREEAETEVMRGHLIGALREGIIGAEKAEELAKSLTDDEIREIAKGGIPSFEPTKKGEDAVWNRGSAGGVVHYDRNGGIDGVMRLIAPDHQHEEQRAEVTEDALEEKPADPPQMGKLEAAIKKVRSEIVKEKHEIFALLDDDGNEVVEREISGENGGNLPPRFIVNAEGKTFIHNHPSGVNDGTGFGFSLSPDDVISASKLDTKSVIAVSERRDYEMRPGKDGWPDDDEIERNFKKQYYDVRTELIQFHKRHPDAVEVINKIHFHLVWKRVAKELGMEYIVHRNKKP